MQYVILLTYRITNYIFFSAFKFQLLLYEQVQRASVVISKQNTIIRPYINFYIFYFLSDNSSFYAKAMSSLDRPSSASHGFEFQSVVNNGNVYDSTNGVFTCPETGLYALAFAVETSGLDFMVYFYRGGSKLNEIGVWPDSSNGLLQDTSSTLQIFLLTRGDQIYLYPSESDARIKPFHSTFSGWRIENRTLLNLIVNTCIYF